MIFMTAEEFISAVSAGGTIDVDSDIDFNNYYFSNEITIPANTTINGNGKIITNIQQGAYNRIFLLNRYTTINKLNFRNVNLPNGCLLYSIDNREPYKQINECQISGIIHSLHNGNGGYDGIYARAINFYRCSITLERFYALTGNLNECYVVLRGNIVKGTSSSWFYFGNTAINTYFKGELSNESGAINSGTAFSGCCFNVDISGNATNSVTLNGNTEITVVNSDKLESSLNGNDFCVGVTESEMHNAKALYDKGFNIYVPGD